MRTFEAVTLAVLAQRAVLSATLSGLQVFLACRTEAVRNDYHANMRIVAVMGVLELDAASVVQST